MNLINGGKLLAIVLAVTASLGSAAVADLGASKFEADFNSMNSAQDCVQAFGANDQERPFAIDYELSSTIRTSILIPGRGINNGANHNYFSCLWQIQADHHCFRQSVFDSEQENAADFVMHVISDDDKSRNVIDAANENEDEDPSEVPEPAIILLWALGGLGSLGTSWRKRRNNMKLAV